MPGLCFQHTPVKRGDVVRILPDRRNDRVLWYVIAVVTSVDLSQENGGYPNGMMLLDSSYHEEVFPAVYERLGNVVEMVGMLDAVRLGGIAPEVVKIQAHKKKRT